MAIGADLGGALPKDVFQEVSEAFDPVNHPSHYTQGDIECIDAIDASMSTSEFRGYLKGNTMKYLWRYGLKGTGIEDLKKSRWYLDRLIAELERE